MISPIENDLALLRALVARELDTINSYRRLAAECEDPVTIEFFTHVVAEEKFHIADALRAIALLDEDQADLLQTGFAAGHDPGHVPAEAGGRATGSGANSISRSDGGDTGVPEVMETQGHSEIQRTRSFQTSEATVRSPGRLDPEFGKASSGPNAGEITRSSRDSGSAKSRTLSTLTVGSLRGVPQHD